MKFIMTQADIDESNRLRDLRFECHYQGKPFDGPRYSRSCPVAMCLRRQTGKVWGVSVEGATTHADEHTYDDEDQKHSIPLPGHVYNFIVNHDMGTTQQPIEWEMDVTP